MIRMSGIVTMVAMFACPGALSASPVLNVVGYDRVQYDSAREGVTQMRSYQRFREEQESAARRGKLGARFVSDVEDDALKLLASTSKMRIRFFRAFTSRLLADHVVSGQEKRQLDEIMRLFFEGNLQKARRLTAQLAQRAESDGARALARNLARTRALGSASHSHLDMPGRIILTGDGRLSTAEGRGEVIGTAIGGGIGILTGGGIPGGVAGGKIGRSIGGWLGKLFKKKSTTTDVWDPPGGGAPCGDSVSGVLC